MVVVLAEVPPARSSIGLENSLSGGKITVLLSAAIIGRFPLGKAARRCKAGKIYGSGERADSIMEWKRVVESIVGIAGRVEEGEEDAGEVVDFIVGAVGWRVLEEEEGDEGVDVTFDVGVALDCAPLSCSVGEESAVSAFKLTGSPICEGFARSLRLFLPACDPEPPSFAADPKSLSVGLESAASAFKLT